MFGEFNIEPRRTTRNQSLGTMIFSNFSGRFWHSQTKSPWQALNCQWKHGVPPALEAEDPSILVMLWGQRGRRKGKLVQVNDALMKHDVVDGFSMWYMHVLIVLLDKFNIHLAAANTPGVYANIIIQSGQNVVFRVELSDFERPVMAFCRCQPGGVANFSHRQGRFVTTWSHFSTLRAGPRNYESVRSVPVLSVLLASFF